MTSHQITMKAVGEFWKMLSKVEPPGIDSEFNCVMVPAPIVLHSEQLEQAIERLRSQQNIIWSDFNDPLSFATQGVYEVPRVMPQGWLSQFLADCNHSLGLPPEPLSIESLMRLAYQVKSESDYFEVFFPSEDKAQMIDAKHSCGSVNERLASWFCFKRGWTYFRRNCSFKNAQLIMRVYLRNIERSRDQRSPAGTESNSSAPSSSWSEW